jgi:peptide-methionine (S)-S-oxide reductase
MARWDGSGVWLFLAWVLMAGLAGAQETPAEGTVNDRHEATVEKATFGAGCFWCVEAVFEELDGVLSVESGYAGGHVPNPTYEQVCSGDTGHAEVCQIKYDPARISFDTLLEVFWKTHDPTTLNRQGPDSGTQYRSVIFYHSDGQREAAEKYKKLLDESGAYDDPIVTQIVPAETFYPAERYHQGYYGSNSNQSYCRLVIRPKLDKFRKVFKDKLKTDVPQSQPKVPERR